MADEKLWNSDLAPTQPEQRNWAWYHYAALWIGMIVAVPAWMLAAGLVEQGMSAAQAALTVLLGNVIVPIPMLLILMMPWRLLASSGGYIFVSLTGYSALLGPIAGILIADYWLIRRTDLTVDDLYRADGAYRYRGGWNPAALIAFAAGLLPNLPGFLATAAPSAFSAGPLWMAIYTWAWLIGIAIALLVYTGLMRLRPRVAAQAA